MESQIFLLETEHPYSQRGNPVRKVRKFRPGDPSQKIPEPARRVQAVVMFGKAPEDWSFEDPPLVGVGRKILFDISI